MKLYSDTVTKLLWNTLTKLMSTDVFNSFRLVGGTSLSLQLGHKESVDIDLFTDSEYGSIDFPLLESKLVKIFTYVDSPVIDVVGTGQSYFIGNNENDSVKLDLYYTEPFVFPCIVEQNIRFASINEVVAMKLETIAGGGRKKDFWDIHELLNVYSMDEMIDFYLLRYPYGLSKDKLLQKVVDFSLAEDDFTPNCYKGKVWELIKLDLVNEVHK